MMRVQLPYPILASRYWQMAECREDGVPVMCVSAEGQVYREQVRDALSRAGLDEPIKGRVALSYVMYPHRPPDWRERLRNNPDDWDAPPPGEEIGELQRVLLDALSGVAFENAGCVRQLEGERAVPVGEARVALYVSLLEDTLVDLPEYEEWQKQQGVNAFAGDIFAPGSIVATPSGRQAVVLRYLQGTGREDAFERVICRYLDSVSDRESVTLQPRFLRRVR